MSCGPAIKKGSNPPGVANSYDFVGHIAVVNVLSIKSQLLGSDDCVKNLRFYSTSKEERKGEKKSVQPLVIVTRNLET